MASLIKVLMKPLRYIILTTANLLPHLHLLELKVKEEIKVHSTRLVITLG